MSTVKQVRDAFIRSMVEESFPRYKRSRIEAKKLLEKKHSEEVDTVARYLFYLKNTSER